MSPTNPLAWHCYACDKQVADQEVSLHIASKVHKDCVYYLGWSVKSVRLCDAGSCPSYLRLEKGDWTTSLN
eukprot:15769782-Heterocapsa_arctica.AAC.1